ncbi:hypothetical protein B0T19DRAFT_476299 [Cercophora scortea]|uniref:Uncharacterized protein n=1 Tax=Cercophora scortea TaxID=314031 RepID=A0AAE0IDG4_9PEZI|nr:hypothetical protein B0T19DRAFT_476299 [Cercophora scortea]
MFGRRRRPVLGTAVVIGASRAAARHEVQKQSTSQLQYEDDVAREAERKRQEEAEQEERTQRAVEQALKKAGLHHDGVSQENITPLVLSPAMAAQTGQTQPGNSTSAVLQSPQSYPGGSGGLLNIPSPGASGATPQNSPTTPGGPVPGHN